MTAAQTAASAGTAASPAPRPRSRGTRPLPAALPPPRSLSRRPLRKGCKARLGHRVTWCPACCRTSSPPAGSGATMALSIPVASGSCPSAPFHSAAHPSSAGSVVAVVPHTPLLLSRHVIPSAGITELHGREPSQTGDPALRRSSARAGRRGHVALLVRAVQLSAAALARCRCARSAGRSGPRMRTWWRCSRSGRRSCGGRVPASSSALR